MEQFLSGILNYLLSVAVATFNQVFVLLGPLLLLAFLMNFVARQNEKLSYKVFGRGVYLYIFGWLGTAVHEIGHAVFAILFGHKINKIVLFSPNPESGSLGHVDHSYNPKSIYQNIGNFFIGIGPVIFGSFMLYLITYILFGFSVYNGSDVKITSEALSGLSSLKFIVLSIWDNFLLYMNLVFTGQGTTWWKIVLLIYFLYSIGSSITLSVADVKGAAKGLVFFIGILLLFNFLTVWIGDFMVNLFVNVSRFFSSLYFLILLTMIVNIIFIIILIIIDKTQVSVRWRKNS